jgi:methionine--tRNA ligase beta chain
MRDMHNADLCGTIGNLVHRVTSLCGKYCDGVVPDVPPPSVLPIADFGALLDSFQGKMSALELQSGANIAIQGFRDVNGYLQEQAPWHIVDDVVAQQIIVRAALEAVYALSHLLLPFLPEGCVKIFAKLGTEPVSLSDLSRDGRHLVVGTPISVGDILYEPCQTEDEANAAVSKKESHAEAQQRKKEAKAKQVAASKAKLAADAAGDESDNQSDFTKMDIRVGKIVKVWNHEAAEKLFCEQIDVGDAEGPREIASGLRPYYSLEEMQDRLVLVVCNLKPAKMVGFTSNGMVLAAKTNDKVELIEAPVDSVVGDRVRIDGSLDDGAAWTSTQVKKKKVWETVAMDLRTGDDGVALWKGQVIRSSTGPCKAATLIDAPIA